MMTLTEKVDHYIPFPTRQQRRKGRTPVYENDTLLKVEDIVGFMATYCRPFTDDDIKYLRRRRRELIDNVCNSCYRLFPEEQPDYRQKTRITQFAVPEECKRQKKLVTDVKAEKIPLKCDGCRVLKLKQAINKETKWRYLKLRSGSVIKTRGVSPPMPIYSGSEYVNVHMTVPSSDMGPGPIIGTDSSISEEEE